MSLAWHEVALARKHNRQEFDCGTQELNDYLRKYARQNHEAGGAKTFVAVEPAQPETILGYYTVSPASLEFARTPASVSKGLGRYDVPVYLLGRLAVDTRWQDMGLGGQLLSAAMARCMQVAQEVGGVALLIDAKDERAAQWYARFGAVPTPDAPLTLVLPFATFAKLRHGA